MLLETNRLNIKQRKNHIKLAYINLIQLNKRYKIIKKKVKLKYFRIIKTICFLILIIFNAFNYYNDFNDYDDFNDFLNLYIIIHKDFNNTLNNLYYKIICDKKSQLKKKYQIPIIETKKNNELYLKKKGYSEGSKIYYIWKKFKEKKISSKYVGFFHYTISNAFLILL